MTTELRYATPYSPSRCRWHRDEAIKVARRAHTPKTDFYFRVNNEIVVGMVRSARNWNRMAIRGGNEAYLWQIARGMSVE